QAAPRVFVPVTTVMGAMALAPICVGWLIFFIHHISNAIGVNQIIDRIRRETEQVIDELMPEPAHGELNSLKDLPNTAALTCVLPNRRSGYIRFVDIPQLRSLTRAYGVCARLER